MSNFFRLYQPLADNWQVYDNSNVGGSRIVAEGQNNTTTTIHQPAVWDTMIRRAGL